MKSALLLLFLPFLLQPAFGQSYRQGVFRGSPVAFEVQGDYGVIDGDIILGRVEDLVTAARTSIVHRDSSVITGAQFRWPNGVIPYVIQAGLPNQQRIPDAITEWNTRTNLKWTARQNETNYVQFVRSTSGCSSTVGMVGGAQNVNLADACTTGQTIHEMGHSAGLWHMQQRNDRDRYVNVFYNNLDKVAAPGNYDSRFQDADDTGPYDWQSIMQYSPTTDQTTPLPSMGTIPPGIPIGQRVRLSAQDIETVMRMYGQVPQGFTVTTNPEGLSITVDNTTYTAPHTFQWAPGDQHTLSVAAMQPLGANTRYSFSSWSDGGDMQHDVTVSAGASTYSAHFIEQFLLRTAVSPVGSGTVTVTPPSPDGYYPVGAAVRLQVTPAAGFNFLQWTAGAGGAVYQTANWQGRSQNPTGLSVLQNDMYYTAMFTQSAVTVITSNFPGRLVTIDGTAFPVPINVAWAANSSHTLSVTSPQAGLNSTSQFVFQKWSNGGAQSQSAGPSSTPYTVQFKQQFEVTSHIVFLIRSGATRPSAANLTVQPASADGFYDAGTTVNFAASDGSEFQFAHWYGSTTGTNSSSSLVVNGQLDVTGEFLSPGFLNNSIVNDASLQPAPLSPGAVVTIYSPGAGPAAESDAQPDGNGQFPTTLAGLTVMFDEFPGTLLAASQNWLRVVAPYGIADRRHTLVAVQNSDGKTVASRSWGVLTSSPGIYTADSSGSGQALAMNADGSPNSPPNPAPHGSTVVLSVVGLGLTDPAADGLLGGDTPPVPLSPVAVQIGGADAPVVSIQQGSAPGVFAIAVTVPNAAPVGGAVPVTCIVDSRPSVGGPTLAIGF